MVGIRSKSSRYTLTDVIT